MDAIELFVKVCEKLDKLRFAGTINWGSPGENIFKNIELKASARLFLFWLCSIIDQFYGYVYIWTTGEKAMLKLVEGNSRSFSDITPMIRDGKEIELGPYNTFVLVRDDYGRIKNIFSFLAKYGQYNQDLGAKFVQLLAELIDGCRRKNGVAKMAYFLDGRLFSDSPVSIRPFLTALERFRQI